MVCALCKQDSTLRNSHILPEWVYKPLYGEKRRLEVLSIAPSGRNELKQKGLREKLLCDRCEQKISVWEGYARSVFVAPKAPLDVERKGHMLRIGGLDYSSLKLFELSILWRAGVSRLPFFTKVQLGGRHEEALRLRLLNSDPGNPADYGAVMFGLKIGDRSEVLHVIAEPQVLRNNGIRTYKFIFCGFLWLFHVSSDVLPTTLNACFLQENGTRVIMVQDALEMQNLRAYSEELRRLGRAPRRRFADPCV